MKIKIIALICLLAFTACKSQNPQSHGPKNLQTSIIQNLDLNKSFTSQIKTEYISNGCSQKDCIPSIDNPQFQSADTANWLKKEDLIIAINQNNIQKVYPIKILNWHQIINDKINGIPTIITYCPLTGTAAIYEATLDNTSTHFGISGLLYNNNLIMYDRLNGDLWLQFSGTAISGKSAEKEQILKALPYTITTWEKWQKHYPDSKVLSLNTGFTQDYSTHPYPNYDNNNTILFNLENFDKSISPKTPIYGIKIDQNQKTFKESEINKEMLDKIGNIPIKITKSSAGEIKFINLNNQNEIPQIRTYWFAWTNLSDWLK